VLSASTRPGGELEVGVGDWVICNGPDDYYPCKPGIFALTYVEVRP